MVAQQPNCWTLFRVRSFSSPGSTPVCGGFFFQDERGYYLHTFVLGKKKRHTTGVDPGKLNERTLLIDQFSVQQNQTKHAVGELAV